MLKKYLALAVMYLFNCFPIKKNKIFLYSYYGSQYGCNPKYITEYILRNYSNNMFDIVWAFNTMQNKEQLNGFRKVKTMSLRYFYELCTSKVVITNFRTTDLYIKRKHQYYIQTWHSSLRLKKIEQDALNSLPTEYISMAKKDSLKCDLLLSGCEFSTRIFERAFWYKGKIFEHGTPRNDVLFSRNSYLREKVFSELKIKSNKKIVLYAPTFRKDNRLDVYNLNYSEALEKLKSKFKGEWIFLVRLHPHLLSKSYELVMGDDVIDVTAYDDIQELLSITDVLITDYSSLMFDFLITKRPCFLYIPDIKEYEKNDRDLYFEIKELPFLSSVNNLELLFQIEHFNEKEYQQFLNRFLKSVGSFEKGNASQKLIMHLEEICFGKNGGNYNAKKAI
ncbi:CDP-glycerol glycerophosphotransferase family protein [Neobacillus niacini]|uniref:CDP-glycerol glycerophosphotransferase family protein n=1 Tax=Neobacillus niacini TaxID=86668 RepID=UPI0028670A74|nr:CDP-glycerol glycerophosphotransferase family protein [Neobacillus niacini]MDR7000611.1 CDP-glycerol glycerophosphotransferase [Neobacillus niacini]